MRDKDDYHLGEIHYLDLDSIETEDDVLDVFGTPRLTEVYNEIRDYNIVLEQARKFTRLHAEYENEAALRLVFMHYGLRRAEDNQHQ